MLSTLLPGIRELRAPLAAGYLWLLAAWIAFESHIPEAKDASGLIAAFYRLNDAFSGVGLAVAASFAAYLIGSLSITLFSPRLRSRFVGVPRVAESLGPLQPLSDQGIIALMTLVRRTWNQMATTLALTEVTRNRVLELEGISPETRGSSSTSNPASVRLTESRGALLGRLASRPLNAIRRLWSPLSTLRIGDTAISFDRASNLDAQHVQLVRTVVGEFDQIIGTRLLGRDPDLFSAIDRHRAEVDFRIALIPALLILSVVLAWTVEPWTIAIVILAGLLACIGLFLDARERERKANDTLAGALVDARVNSPTLQALEQRTSTIAKQPRAEKMQQAGADAVSAMGELIDMLDRMERNRRRAESALDAVRSMRRRSRAVRGLFPDSVVAELNAALEAIRRASELWVEAARNSSDESRAWDEAREQAQAAKSAYEAFRNAAVNAIEELGPQTPGLPATGEAPAGSTPAGGQ